MIPSIGKDMDVVQDAKWDVIDWILDVPYIYCSVT